MSAILNNISGILTITLCGPNAPGIQGPIKDVGLTFVGFIFFNTKAITAPVFTGIFMSFMGAAFFAYMNY